MTATHTEDELQQALDVLKRVGKRMGILSVGRASRSCCCVIRQSV